MPKAYSEYLAGQTDLHNDFIHVSRYMSKKTLTLVCVMYACSCHPHHGNFPHVNKTTSTISFILKCGFGDGMSVYGITHSC